VADLSRVDMSLASIRNLVAATGAEVETVFHQDAVEALVKDSPHEGEVRELIRRGVKIAACSIALKTFGISAERLINGVEVMDSGVAEIVRKQEEGWTYLRL